MLFREAKMSKQRLTFISNHFKVSRATGRWDTRAKSITAETVECERELGQVFEDRSFQIRVREVVNLSSQTCPSNFSNVMLSIRTGDLLGREI